MASDSRGQLNSSWIAVLPFEEVFIILLFYYFIIFHFFFYLAGIAGRMNRTKKSRRKQWEITALDLRMTDG